MAYQIPDPSDSFEVTMSDGAALRVRRHGRADARLRLVMSHGNGFAIDGYLPFWGPLCERFDVVVFDFRNHGRNPRSEPANHHYVQMTSDLARVHGAIVERLGTRRNVGVFHSMSARTAMKDAVENGWRWDALVLFDPPNVPPPDHALFPKCEAFEKLLVDWASRRRERFADPSELAAEYARSRAHRTWVEGAHELMARAVLRQDAAAGDWFLACPRELEASIYRQALSLNLWPPASAFGGPVALLASDPEMEGAATPAFANRALGTEHGYDYAAVPGTGHLLQIQRPDACRDAMLSFLERRGLID